MVPQRIQIYRLIRDHGPLHINEIADRMPSVGRHTLHERLSELASGRWPWFRVRRVMRGVYEVEQ